MMPILVIPARSGHRRGSLSALDRQRSYAALARRVLRLLGLASLALILLYSSCQPAPLPGAEQGAAMPKTQWYREVGRSAARYPAFWPAAGLAGAQRQSDTRVEVQAVAKHSHEHQVEGQAGGPPWNPTLVEALEQAERQCSRLWEALEAAKKPLAKLVVALEAASRLQTQGAGQAGVNPPRPETTPGAGVVAGSPLHPEKPPEDRMPAG